MTFSLWPRPASMWYSAQVGRAGLQGLNQKARAMGAVEEPLAAARTSVDAGSDVPQQMQVQLEEATSALTSESMLDHR